MGLKSIIKTDLVTVSKYMKLHQVAEVMHQNHVGSVVVIENKISSFPTPIGIITDRDIALSLSHKEDSKSDLIAANIMNENVIMGYENDGIYKIIQSMKNNGIRRMPIISSKKELVGMITLDDLVSLLANELKELSDVLKEEVDREKNIVKKQNRNEQLMAINKQANYAGYFYEGGV